MGWIEDAGSDLLKKPWIRKFVRKITKIHDPPPKNRHDQWAPTPLLVCPLGTDQSFNYKALDASSLTHAVVIPKHQEH